LNTSSTAETTQTIRIPQQSIPASLRCRHIHSEGRRCGSPSLRGESYCYHHHQTRRPVANLHHRRARQAAFTLPAPNSRPEIQQAIGSIMLRLAVNDIDTRRAGLLLYALQIAQTNLTEHQRLQTKPQPQSATSPATQHQPAPAPQQPEPANPKQCPPEQNEAQANDSRLAQPSNLNHQHESCPPERSEAQSKDLQLNHDPETASETPRIHYGTGPTPDLDHPSTTVPQNSIDFTPPPPLWRRLSPAVGAALLDAFCRQATGHSEPSEDPLPASSPDRSPGPRPEGPYMSPAAPSAPHPSSATDPCME